tara:strand:+ start:11709 stop:12116 length:408 start_codon:yes stop_codon:yes gene_type:complete
MKLNTSFGQINFLDANIAEVIINENIEITLEIVDEYDALMAQHFSGSYAVLVNRINSYRFAYEALLCIGSEQNLKALAIINYNKASEQQTRDLKSVRHMDNLNIEEFSGLELGRENAIHWLNEQLTYLNKSETIE